MLYGSRRIGICHLPGALVDIARSWRSYSLVTRLRRVALSISILQGYMTCQNVITRVEWSRMIHLPFLRSVES